MDHTKITDQQHELCMHDKMLPNGSLSSPYQMKLWSTCNLHNLVLSQLMIKRNTKSKRSLTPGSGGASYGTWLSSSGAHTPIICGSPTLMSMPKQLSRIFTSSTLMPHAPPPPPLCPPLTASA